MSPNRPPWDTEDLDDVSPLRKQVYAAAGSLPYAMRRRFYDYERHAIRRELYRERLAKLPASEQGRARVYHVVPFDDPEYLARQLVLLAKMALEVNAKLSRFSSG